MDTELRSRVYRDATHMVNALGSLRRGEFYTEQAVIEVMHKVRLIAWDLLLLCEYPQMRLWEKEDYDHTSQDTTKTGP